MTEYHLPQNRKENFNEPVEKLLKGFIKENPILVLVLGTCPTLGTTSSAINGFGMGLATTFVLFMSNMAISSIKNLVPDKEDPAYVV